MTQTYDADISLPTDIPNVYLRALTVSDALALYELIQENKDHLTQFGDYHDLVSWGLQDVEAYLTAPTDDNIRMGIWRGNELVGRVDLVPIETGVFGLGYWLGCK
ncbi:MAG: hypothetical protein GX316_08680, partial [Firmicutes bacterium]|nr:hypothetical protein [Bacillota bacterium]